MSVALKKKKKVDFDKLLSILHANVQAGVCRSGLGVFSSLFWF